MSATFSIDFAGGSDGLSTATKDAGETQSKSVTGVPEASAEKQPYASWPANTAASSGHHSAAPAAKAALPSGAAEASDAALQPTVSAPAASTLLPDVRAVPDTTDKAAPGFSLSSKGKQAVESSDVHLPERTSGHAAPTTGAEKASPTSPSPSPAASLSTLGSRTYPTWVESPGAAPYLLTLQIPTSKEPAHLYIRLRCSAAGGATPRGTPYSSLVEPRYVDSAAANAKRAAEAVGLGSLFSPIDQASTSLKRGLAPRQPAGSAGFFGDWRPSGTSEQFAIGTLPGEK